MWNSKRYRKRRVAFDRGDKGFGELTASIVIQKYYYGMTAKEIGQRAGLSKNAVEKRLKRGLEKLKTVLQSEHDQLA